MPGWVLLALGIGAAAAGAVLIAVNGRLGIWTILLGAGAVGMLAGIGLMMAGGNRPAATIAKAALKNLSDAQRRLNSAAQSARRDRAGLSEMSKEMG